MTQERKYLATANVYGGKYTVSEIHPGCAEIKQIGDCRDFDTFEEADDVAFRMAAGEFTHIRPAGVYISNR